MVTRLLQSNGHMKRKLRAWRVQKCISLVGVQIPYLTVRGRKLPHVMGDNIGSRKKICKNSGLPIPMVPHLHQSNGYIKSKLRAWRVRQCIALVSANTVLTSTLTQTTPFPGGWYRPQNENMRNFGPTNPHGTAFAPKQWLYEKEPTGMENSKMYFPRWCRYCTYQCVAANYPVSWGELNRVQK